MPKTSPIPIPFRLPSKPVNPYSPVSPKVSGLKAKSVTIALGFRSNDSFVFAADRLFTHGQPQDAGVFGSYAKKIFSLQAFSFSVLITGAGDRELLRSTAERIMSALEKEDKELYPNGRIQERIAVKDILEAELSSLSERIGSYPTLSLLVAVRQEKFGLDFLRSDGVTVRSAENAEILGIGENSLVQYLVDSLYSSDLNSRQVATLTALIVQVSKKYCPQYCGGETDICGLAFDGDPIQWVEPRKIQELEATLASTIPDKLSEAIQQAWLSRRGS